MTKLINYSDWQDSTIDPQIDGAYERRCELGIKWGELPLGRFRAGKWFVEENGNYSMWQADCESPWQWRGLVALPPSVNSADEEFIKDALLAMTDA